MRRLILAAVALPSVVVAQQPDFAASQSNIALSIGATPEYHLLQFMDGKGCPVVSINLDNAKHVMAVKVGDCGITMDDSAKLFWNRVAELAAQPDPFPGAAK